MHQSRLWMVAASLAAVLVAGGIAVASTHAAATAHGKTLHFLLREQQQVLDRAPSGPSNGDLILLRGDLLNPQTRRVVGKEVGMYVMVDAATENRSAATVVFTPNATTRLASANQITLGTIFDSSPPPQIAAITGGTGRYRDAHGQVVASDGPDGLIDIVIHLS